MPQESDQTQEQAETLKGKAILFISSGNLSKRFIFQKAKNLGIKIVLLNTENNWANRYCDHLINADTYDHAAAITKVEEFLDSKTCEINGAVTFVEDDLPLLAKLCEKFGWIGNSFESSINCRNKLKTRQILEQKGLGKYSMPFAQVRSQRDIERACQKTGFPCVLKPAWGASSQFVVRVNDIKEAKNTLRYIQNTMSPQFDPIFSYGTEILCEGYIDGAELDVDVLLQDEKIKFFSFTDNFPTKEPFFVEAGDAMPSRHEDAILEKMLEMAKETIAAFELKNGALHIEAKIDSGMPKLVEINARMGGDYVYDWIKTIWGVDIIEEAMKIAAGIPSKPAKNPEPSLHLTSKYIVPSASGVVAGITLPDISAHADKIHDISILKEIGDPVLVPPEGFDQLGWVTGKGRTYAEADENLQEAISRLSVTTARFDSTSSIGKTRRKDRFSYASIARKRIIQSARLEKIRGFDTKTVKSLHVGILCNKYEEAGEEEPAENGNINESLVHRDLTSVGLNIQKALEAKDHRVTFFDLNETPLPFEKIANANVDIIFNVCERINNASLLEPHAAAILDCLGIPYTGSNPLTLALCIDKIKIKKLLSFHNIPTPKFDYIFDKDEPVSDELRYPLIVKPANTDNSIGIDNNSVVESPKQLKERTEEIIEKLKRPVLVEEFIEGDELDVCIMGNAENVKVLPLSRSVFDDMPRGFWHIYPFRAKWTDDPVYKKIRTERPAKYSQKLTQLISEICLDVYNILDCHDYARIELRVDKDGNPYVIEANPNPSINMGDCVPASAELIGLSYGDFIEEILKSAIIRYRNRPPYYHLQSGLLNLV